MRNEFQNTIANVLIDLLREMEIKSSIEDYDASTDDEEMFLIDIDWTGESVTIASDFVLVDLESDKYEFENWRYESTEILVEDLKKVIKEKLYLRVM